MLVDGMSGKQITRPSFYDSTYKLVRTRLSRAEIDQAIAGKIETIK